MRSHNGLSDASHSNSSGSNERRKVHGFAKLFKKRKNKREDAMFVPPDDSTTHNFGKLHLSFTRKLPYRLY